MWCLIWERWQVDLGVSLDIFPSVPPLLTTLLLGSWVRQVCPVDCKKHLLLYTRTCSVLCYSTEEDVIGDFRHNSLESLLYQGWMFIAVE